jgi:outer membrane biogenesis lipoprotein LolB
MPNLSRCAAVKMLFASVWAALLSACKGLASVPTSTPTNTPTPTDTPIPCFTLVGPDDGAELPAAGRVTFEWTEQFDGTSYRLEITRPDGKVLPYETERQATRCTTPRCPGAGNLPGR